jgi:hypothetical protein
MSKQAIIEIVDTLTEKQREQLLANISAWIPNTDIFKSDWGQQLYTDLMGKHGSFFQFVVGAPIDEIDDFCDKVIIILGEDVKCHTIRSLIGFSDTVDPEKSVNIFIIEDYGKDAITKYSLEASEYWGKPCVFFIRDTVGMTDLASYGDIRYISRG